MKSIAQVRGTINNDAFYFPLTVNGKTVGDMILDTGAFELTFNGRVAKTLGLPNLGTIQIGGVGGSAQAYQSVCSLQIGGKTYKNVPCIVDPSFEQAGLFGLRFFIDNDLLLLLNPESQTLSLLTQ